MATDYILASDLKSMLGMAGDDNTRDDLIDRAISAASRLIDRETGRTFGLDNTATARVFNPCGEGDLTVDDIGSTSGLVVETGNFGSSDWATVPTTDYETGPVNAIAKGQPITSILKPSSWGNSYARVRVTAKWGWPEVPSEVEQATAIMAMRLFKRKDSPEGVMGSAEWGFARVSRVDPDVQALIAHLILPGF